EPETGLSVRIEAMADGQIVLRYGHFPELLNVHADGTASNDDMRVRPTSEGLWMDRPLDNQSSRLRRLDGEPTLDVAGHYRCAELDAELTVVDAGGVLY